MHSLCVVNGECCLAGAINEYMLTVNLCCVDKTCEVLNVKEYRFEIICNVWDRRKHCINHNILLLACKLISIEQFHSYV